MSVTIAIALPIAEEKLVSAIANMAEKYTYGISNGLEEAEEETRDGLTELLQSF